MKPYAALSKEALLELRSQLQKEYADYQGMNLKLDMSRGKPSSDQLDLASGLLKEVNAKEECFSEDGTDCRNYGVLEGLPEARRLMGDLLGVSAKEVLACGNSSLNLMYDMIASSCTHGVAGNTPWSRLDKVKFLCIVPGYDRHFAITQHFGLELVSVPMLDGGPDMDKVEELAAKDDSIKGIWCVPKYSNPTGTSYSDAVVRRFAALKPAAADFRIYWDNAYGVHHIYDEEKDRDQLLNILRECEKAGNPDLVYVFASTAKISYAGAGISALAASEKNLADILGRLKFMTIGYDKINQLRHVRFYGSLEGIDAHMKKQAAIIRPKFETVARVLKEELGGCGIASWTNPRGGYFVSFDTMEGCAKKVIRLCKEAGVVLTPAGAAFPLGIDPLDKNIRIAPTFPSVNELETAVRLLCLCTKLASIDVLLAG